MQNNSVFREFLIATSLVDLIDGIQFAKDRLLCQRRYRFTVRPHRTRSRMER